MLKFGLALEVARFVTTRLMLSLSFPFISFLVSPDPDPLLALSLDVRLLPEAYALAAAVAA